MLERHPDSPYAKWLKHLEKLTLGTRHEKVDFKAPPLYLTTSWGMNLRTDATTPIREGDIPDHAANSIKTYLGAISGTNAMMGRKAKGSDSALSVELKEALADWMDDDETIGAPAFDFCKDLPTLWKGAPR